MKKVTRLLVTAMATTLSLTAFSGCSLIGGFTEDTGTESLEYTVEESQQKINKIATTGGLEVKVKFFEEANGEDAGRGETTFGMKDGIYWNFDEDGDGIAYTFNADKTLVYGYEYDGEQWVYDYTYEVTQEESATLDGFFGFSTWLYFGHMYDGMLKKSGTTKVAGRDCIVFKYAFNIIIEKLEYTLVVDKETGVTMKYDMGARVAGESASMGFEVTSFKTSGVTAPRLPEPTKIDDVAE